jgi:hypothetical protein
MLLFLSPLSANSMLSLCHGKLPKVISALFTTLNWGREGDEICFVNVNRLQYWLERSQGLCPRLSGCIPLDKVYSGIFRDLHNLEGISRCKSRVELLILSSETPEVLIFTHTPYTLASPFT